MITEIVDETLVVDRDFAGYRKVVQFRVERNAQDGVKRSWEGIGSPPNRLEMKEANPLFRSAKKSTAYLISMASLVV